jgi:hypothetical protein
MIFTFRGGGDPLKAFVPDWILGQFSHQIIDGLFSLDAGDSDLPELCLQ